MPYMQHYMFKMFKKYSILYSIRAIFFVTHMEIILTGIFTSIAFVFFAYFR